LNIKIIRRKILICTICCREKDRAEGLLPAVRRYRSDRIRKVHSLARKAGLPFAILSGKFGLIDGEEPIPYYDKLMEGDYLGRIIGLNTAFLKKNGIRKVIFLLPDPADDPHLRPYLRSLQSAARAAGNKLETIFVPPYPESLMDC
jgi:hypothetical protein